MQSIDIDKILYRKRKRCWLYLIAATVAAALVLASNAYGVNDGDAPVIGAERTDAPITIDGKLDEPCWQRASAVTGFIDHKTEKPAREQTTVRVCYDDQWVYIGFTCSESDPNGILAVERKERLIMRRLPRDQVVEEPAHVRIFRFPFALRVELD